MRALTFSIATIAALAAAGAQAASIDFEGALSEGETRARVTETTVFDGVLQISSHKAVRLVSPGGKGVKTSSQKARKSAKRDRMYAGDGFGDTYIKGARKKKTGMKLTFLEDVYGLSFDLGDIDGGKDARNKGGSMKGRKTPKHREFFTIVAFHDGKLVEKIRIDSSMFRGRASIANIAFADGPIDEVKIKGRTRGGKRKIAWGLDNISFFGEDEVGSLPRSLTKSVSSLSEAASVPAVPVPASALLLVAGLGALGAVRKARKA